MPAELPGLRLKSKIEKTGPLESFRTNEQEDKDHVSTRTFGNVGSTVVQLI